MFLGSVHISICGKNWRKMPLAQGIFRNGVSCLSKVGRTGCVADIHATLGNRVDTNYFIHKFEVNSGIIIGIIVI